MSNDYNTIRRKALKQIFPDTFPSQKNEKSVYYKLYLIIDNSDYEGRIRLFWMKWNF